MSGYDAPASKDVLNRWPIVREVAKLAVEAKPEWSVRIGVYGEWGTGKTTVLHQVEALVDELGHVPVRFNPWGHNDSDEMFRELADAAIAKLESKHIKVKGAAGRKAKALGRIVAGAADGIGKGAAALGAPEATVAAAKVPASRLSRFLKNSAADFEDIQAALDEHQRRLVVFVDDVDRVDPIVLPQLLFALHDVLALNGFSYVLALDPKVVGNALRAHHEGFDDGLAFLDKIIQFPRWIPEPTTEALWELIKRDAGEDFPEILEALGQERELLPTNPRALRSFLRNLWPLRAELQRHTPDELDLNLLVLLSALRAVSPGVLRSLVGDCELLDEIATSAVFAPNDDEIQKLRERLCLLVDEAHDGSRAQPLALLKAMVARSILWNSERIRYHAHLADRPHAVTWKEFEEFWMVLNAESPVAALDDLIDDRAINNMHRPESVAKELVQLCVGKHLSELSNASEDFSFEAMSLNVMNALSTVRVIEALCFDTKQNVPIDAVLFEHVRTAFVQWAHFTNHERYLELRDAERDLLIRVVEASSEPASIVETLKPWDEEERYRRPEAKAIDDELRRRLSIRVAEGLVSCFERPSGVSGIMREPMHARRFLLFRAGPAWTDAQKEHLADITKHPSATVAANCLEFLRCIVDPSQARDSLANKDVQTIAQDVPLVRSLWAGVCGVRANPRFVTGISELHEKLQDLAGELPVPEWLAER